MKTTSNSTPPASTSTNTKPPTSPPGSPASRAGATPTSATSTSNRTAATTLMEVKNVFDFDLCDLSIATLTVRKISAFIV